MTEFMARDDVIEATWRILGGMGYNLKNNDRLREEVDSVIEDYPTVDVVSAADFRDCRNELCLKCGAYTQKHNGACDGCRWHRFDDAPTTIEAEEK